MVAIREVQRTLNVILSTRTQFVLRRPFLDVGEWLSLVEHLVRDQGVGGSNPLSPTNSSSTYKLLEWFKWVQLAIALPQIEAKTGFLSMHRAGQSVPLYPLESVFVSDTLG